jgi:FkbM family methyltransferase
MQLTQHIQQGLRLISRKRRAGRLGFRFTRARDFAIPDEIRIAGRRVSVVGPAENGINTCFVDVFLDDCYGLEQVGSFKQGRILDIGGNVGMFALAARNAFPKSTIHVYEPNPRMLPFLSSHAAAANFSYFAEAVGRDDGQISLVDHQDCVQVRTKQDDRGGIPQVAFRRAIERIGGHCDLVKLDCEGAEWDILADTASWQHVDHLAMEYHLWAGRRQHDDVQSLMDSIGFRIDRQISDHADFGIVLASRRQT